MGLGEELLENMTVGIQGREGDGFEWFSALQIERFLALAVHGDQGIAIA